MLFPSVWYGSSAYGLYCPCRTYLFPLTCLLRLKHVYWGILPLWSISHSSGVFYIEKGVVLSQGCTPFCSCDLCACATYFMSWRFEQMSKNCYCLLLFPGFAAWARLNISHTMNNRWNRRLPISALSLTLSFSCEIRRRGICPVRTSSVSLRSLITFCRPRAFSLRKFRNGLFHYHR